MSSTSDPATAATREGLIFLLVAPSGAGKSTIIEEVLNKLPNLRESSLTPPATSAPERWRGSSTTS